VTSSIDRPSAAANQKVTARARLEAGGCQRLDPRIRAHAHARERSKREVVVAEALEVARDRAREVEEPHGDDRGGKGEDRRRGRREGHHPIRMNARR
jgi:hypothetical protein